MKMNINHIKETIKPIQVARNYLGNPIRTTTAGSWYKSPFRQEKTASFLVSNNRGFHDFGTSKHYDVISFVQELFNTDFKTAVSILCREFGIIENTNQDRDLTKYLVARRYENVEKTEKLDNWYNFTFDQLCTEYQANKRLLKYVNAEAKRFVYLKDIKLEIILEDFMDKANEKEKLYREYKGVKI